MSGKSTLATKQPEPVTGKCSGCNHEWPIAYLPMEMSKAGKIMSKAECPYGCTAFGQAKVLMA